MYICRMRSFFRLVVTVNVVGSVALTAVIAAFVRYGSR